MTIRILVPGSLRREARGTREIAASVSTVEEALEFLEREYLELHRRICDETGTVRRHLNIFVNTENIRDREGIATRLSDGDVVHIIPAVSGGLR